MRGDESWVAGLNETARMSSIIGLPTRGSDVTVLITKVHLHPLCELVEFWGNFSQERAADYEYLAKDIQSPGNTFKEFEGNPGDQCLVHIDGIWYRCRIVTRNGSKYSVFLIDKGVTYSTTASKLAWGQKKHFHLPPEVEFCVLANVLPHLPENRWSPVALAFLKSLSGKSVKAHVQDVLVAHRMFLLHIPCISKQMYEMGFAKKLSSDMFQDFVLVSLQSQSGAEVSPVTRQISMGASERLHKQEHFMYPELPAGTVETVIVTDVTNPQRIFCQLKVFSQELKKLSEQITQLCEGRMTHCIVGPEMIGFPCAARGSDGRWYRSILQQVFPTNKVVEVLNVDYGTKQFVQVENVRPLAAEFFRMPVVTYICSLHGVIDKGVGWTTSQIDYFRSLLLYKTVIAKFEYQSVSEGVHYVTLYGDENTNINNLFSSKESCSLGCEKTLGDYAIRSTAYSLQHPALQEGNQRKMLTPGQAIKEKEGKGMLKLPSEELRLNSSHMVAVQDIADPSEFWIQTHNYADELDTLMDSIYHLYKNPMNNDVVRNPSVGLYCAAKAEDGDFYRATVAEVGEKKIKVFFVDYGNTELVDSSNIRTLPDKFKKLPCLALKCTLAGIKPKDERWSQSACEFFIKAVKDKTLNVHVTAKHDDGYVVKLTDHKAQGERDLSTLMCSAGLAERVEIQRQPKAKMTTQPAIIPSTQLSDARLSGVWNKGMSFQALNTVTPASSERRILTFKEHMFPIGSVLDVTVSYIESPNDFWCQLVQNAGHLKLLMQDIQARYADTEFHSLVETACIARHPDNGMWYRALLIHKHETPHVDVLFVDYGQMETVSLYDLRRICPEFLTLHGQAFRCSLLNPVDPTTATNEWSEEAIARFHSFVETAASNFVILKCTIYAVMYSEQKIVFNIVDLETPFESISTSMVSLVKSAPTKKVSGTSFRLDTYYYSTHNVKTGTEEQVTVTCVNNVSQFYCQLKRNADVIKDLRIKVNNLCHQLENVKLPTVFGTLCFAKYTDGHWYRGQIKATKPVILVHFVDYGDTIEVEKSDLLPVPREANDIMSVPVQAVLCGLCDVPAHVPSEVNSWFETSATECKFRALVVAREPDGKLLVELYHGNTQINSKIKKMFQIEMHTEGQVVCHGRRAHEASANHAQKTPKAFPQQAAEMEGHSQPVKKNVSAPKSAHQMRNTNMNLQSVLMPLHNICENGQKVKAAPLQLYRPPHQRQSSGRTPNNTENGPEPAGAYIRPRKESPSIKSKSPDAESQKDSNAQKLPKLEDLPSKSITPGMEADVYVSHCNSPLSLYVQLVREEDELLSLVGKLNDPQSTTQTIDIKDVHPGDLVQAEFADDSSWYRAVVTEIQGNMMVLVEFVDFGNTAVMPISKIGRLQKHFLQSPMYSTHCMLSSAAALGKEEVLDAEVVSAFKEDISGTEEKVLKCQFIRQSGSLWEVSLDDGGVKVMCKVPTRCSTSEITSEKLEQVKKKPDQNADIRQMPENSKKSLLTSCSLFCHQQEILEGQKLEVYITTTNDNLTFWSQSTVSEELDKITSSVSEVGGAADHKIIDPGSLSPGSPCIALFSDDHLWYRAEILDGEGDELCVFFVDYGNKSQVNVTDVREMPTNLMEAPPQAFLCELEGFDASVGSWDSGAVDEFSALTTDKALQLTVTRVTREEGKIRYLVQMECEGQVINEALKTWWKGSLTENKPAAVGLTTLYETPLQCDSTVKETAPAEDQIEDPCVHPQIDYIEEQGPGELVEPQRADEVYKLESSSQHYESPEDCLIPESFAESAEEERDKILTFSNEGVIVDPAIKVSQTKPKGISPCESEDETVLPSLSNIGDHGILTLSCDKDGVKTDEGTEEEGASVMDTIGPDDFKLTLVGNPTEAIDEAEITMTRLESLLGEVKTYLKESSFGIMNVSDPNEQRDDIEVVIARDKSPGSMSTVKMVPREDVHLRERMDLETIDEISKDLIQTELVPSSHVLPVFEQETKAGDGVPKEQIPCVATHVKNDLMAEEDTLAQHDVLVSSAPLAETNTAACEPHTCTAPSRDSGDEVKEVTCSDEEACLMDVCTDPHEPNDDSKVTSGGGDCLRSGTEQEVVQNESLFSLRELPHEQFIALPSDTEPQTCTAPFPDLSNLVEEVTCLVREICLTDVCRDPQKEAETEDREQLVHTPPEQEQDFSDGELEKEASSSADDSFEAQLSKIIHLSLIINDASADTRHVKQQPEE
ncbi:tudor domain-containing 6 [Larimichthys crocea]|uniref:tudor domain-containing 6 n=1 Tax=Larimichthys crocea TaxID=215358 RepID=UPI000901D733|nr:tudor domain-containing protein 6 [Larimichthys crocea]